MFDLIITLCNASLSAWDLGERHKKQRGILEMATFTKHSCNFRKCLCRTVSSFRMSTGYVESILVCRTLNGLSLHTVKQAALAAKTTLRRSWNEFYVKQNRFSVEFELFFVLFGSGIWSNPSIQVIAQKIQVTVVQSDRNWQVVTLIANNLLVSKTLDDYLFFFWWPAGYQMGSRKYSSSII